jgi:hypothetical protein
MASNIISCYPLFFIPLKNLAFVCFSICAAQVAALSAPFSVIFDPTLAFFIGCAQPPFGRHRNAITIFVGFQSFVKAFKPVSAAKNTTNSRLNRKCGAEPFIHDG